MSLTREDVIRIAREAGFDVDDNGALWLYGSKFYMNENCEGRLTDGIKKMVQIAINEERKACAEICNDVWRENGGALECREKIIRRAA